MARFANPALIYHCRRWTAPSVPAAPPTRSFTESPVYHPVAIHRDLDHIHPMVTRRAVGVLCSVDWLVPMINAPLNTFRVSSPIRATLADPQWRRAMEEYATLLANHTWDLVSRPLGTNVVTGKWIFRHKLTSDALLDRYKALWVLRGFTQRPGVDYDETFSLVVKLPPFGLSSPLPSLGTRRSINSMPRMLSSTTL